LVRTFIGRLLGSVAVDTSKFVSFAASVARIPSPRETGRRGFLLPRAA
jgi:hypothetical protein